MKVLANQPQDELIEAAYQTLKKRDKDFADSICLENISNGALAAIANGEVMSVLYQVDLQESTDDDTLVKYAITTETAVLIQSGIASLDFVRELSQSTSGVLVKVKEL